MALDFMHAKQFCHFDIKPENIFLKIYQNNQINIKLGDFGFARKIDSIDCEDHIDIWTNRNLLYMAPEIIENIENINNRLGI